MVGDRTINTPVRVRIGPSPTGEPHVGTAYVALFNHAFARKHGGTFIVRIEDTDQKRSSHHSEEQILASLKWLGLQWDEGPDVGGPRGPYRQSERLESYQRAVQQLLDQGHAYWCTCTTERLTTLRQRQRMLGQPTGYDGHCRARDPAEVQREKEQGAQAVVRLKAPQDGRLVRFTDLLRGEVSIAAAELDDQVLLKSDGFPTYHLANVVDDAAMGITHVLRGEEWISSTPKHVLLYQFLGHPLPRFAHLPLLRNADKSKVSKRKNPVSLDYFRQAGYLPDALLNFLGLMAFSMPQGREMFSLDEFIAAFDLDRVSLGGPVFDLDKLLWLNGRYLRERRDTKQWVEYLQHQLFNPEYLAKIVPLVQERVNRSDDFIAYADFFFTGDVSLSPENYVMKGLAKKETIQAYEELTDQLTTLHPFTAEELERCMRTFCATKQLSTRALFMPVRLMVTGKKASPPLFATMAVLGRQRCLTRIRQAVLALRRAKLDSA